MARVTPKDNADFVVLMINRDLETMPDNEDKLSYLSSIGNHVDETGEEILRRPKPKIGEDRPEHGPDDLDVMSILKEVLPNADIIDGNLLGGSGLLELLFELSRPEGQRGLNPPEFLKANTCYKGAKAREWLYKNKYTHEYDHIHVFSNDLCLLMPEDSINGHYAWIAPDGVREEGEPADVLKEMFLEYMSSINPEDESYG